MGLGNEEISEKTMFRWKVVAIQAVQLTEGWDVTEDSMFPGVCCGTRYLYSQRYRSLGEQCSMRKGC